MIATRKHGWIGIDFGTKVTKVAQLERAGGELRLNRITLERSETADGISVTGQQLREALDVCGRFRGQDVACTLPMSATDLRVVTIPPGNESERRAMIAQELEAVYGGEVARVFDFWETDAPTAQDSVNVLSVDSAQVAAVTQTLSAAGLECRVLDGLPCALARALAVLPVAAQGPMAAIDWGHANATLAIVEHGRPQFTRMLRDCGAGAMFVEVGQALGLTEAEAGEVLARFGLPDPARPDPNTNEIGEVVAEIVAGPIQRMVDELTRTFSFLRLQRQALLPTQMRLLGAGATVRNSAAFLAAKLETPCEPWHLANHDGAAANGEELFGPAAALSALAWGEKGDRVRRDKPDWYWE